MPTDYRDVRHKLISEIHGLLSIATADEFIAASRMCKSDHIRVALRALAEEQIRSEHESPRERARPEPSMRSAEAGDIFDESQASNAEAIAEFLVSSNRFPSKASLFDLVRIFTLALEPDPKESRFRLALRIGKSILNGPPHIRRIFFDKVLNLSGPSETEGWADILRSRQDG